MNDAVWHEVVAEVARRTDLDPAVDAFATEVQSGYRDPQVVDRTAVGEAVVAHLAAGLIQNWGEAPTERLMEWLGDCPDGYLNRAAQMVGRHVGMLCVDGTAMPFTSRLYRAQ